MFKATLMLWLASAAMAEDLLPLQFIREVHMAVYELPELAGRTEMLGAVDASLKRAFPQAEVINAGGMPDAALREKIQGPFLLVTSLDERARLLPLRTGCAAQAEGFLFGAGLAADQQLHVFFRVDVWRCVSGLSNRDNCGV